MTTAFVTFTLLWVLSCTLIYFKMLDRLEQADKRYRDAARLFEEAEKAFGEAAETNMKAAERLQQITNSLNCLN